MVTGQRTFASRVRSVVKGISTEFFMCSESAIEAFCDLLDLDLYHYNIYPDFVPLRRTIYGDYLIGHGRVLSQADIYAEPRFTIGTTNLFLTGALLGRIYCSPETPIFLLAAGNEEYLDFFKLLAAYSEADTKYLRFGEYLKPISLSPEPPAVSYVSTDPAGTVTMPGLAHSVTRSHQDGSVAVVFVNVSSQPLSTSFLVDPELCDQNDSGAIVLFVMDENGTRTVVGNNMNPWMETVTLNPREVAFYIVTVEPTVPVTDISLINDDSVLLSWTYIEGRNYQIYYSDLLGSGAQWVAVETSYTVNENIATQVIVLDTGVQRRFYKIEVW